VAGDQTQTGMNELLAICIPTFNRAGYLRECLDSFLPQISPLGIPVYVSDNASTDDTLTMLRRYQAERYPHLFFRSNPNNLGIDRNMAAVVEMARTRFCWLFGDDDIVRPGAVAAVLDKLQAGFELVIVNASGNAVDFSQEVLERRIPFRADRVYEPGEQDALLRDTAAHASYLGSLVVSRARWLAHREVAYATDYYHIAVVYAYAPRCRSVVIAEPYIRCRLRNSSWSQRMFEVLMLNWPQAIWSLGPEYSAAAKAAVTPPNRARSVRYLMAARAMGLYDRNGYRLLVERGICRRGLRRLAAALVARAPEELWRVLFGFYLRIARTPSRELYLNDMRLRRAQLREERRRRGQKR